MISMGVQCGFENYTCSGQQSAVPHIDCDVARIDVRGCENYKGRDPGRST